MRKPVGLMVATGLLTLFTVSVTTTNVSTMSGDAPAAVSTVGGAPAAVSTTGDLLKAAR